MKNFFTGNKIKVLLHLLAWIIILGLPLYFFKRWDVGKDFIWLYYIGNINKWNNFLFKLSYPGSKILFSEAKNTDIIYQLFFC